MTVTPSAAAAINGCIKVLLELIVHGELDQRQQRLVIGAVSRLKEVEE